MRNCPSRCVAIFVARSNVPSHGASIVIGYEETTMAALPETRDIAPAQRFDVAALSAYLADHIDGFQGLEDVRQFKGGASNPTFLIIEKGGGGRLFVMRKKPPGQLLASAHQVDREYRVMNALADTGV